MSLAKKFSLGITILVVGVLGLVTVVTLTIGHKTLRSQVLTNSLSEATLAARAIEQYVTDAAWVMREASTRPKLGREIRSGNWGEAREVLENMKGYFQQFDYFFIQDPQGFIRARVPHAETVGQDFSFREFFQQAVKTHKPYISGVYVSKAAKRSVVSIAVPVLEGDTVKGVLVGALSLKTLSNFISGIGRGHSAILCVVDEKGVLVAHSEDMTTTEPVDMTKSEIVQAAMAGQNATMEFSDPETGETLLGAFVPLKQLGWKVIAQQPVSVAYASINELLKWFVLLTLGSSGIAIILGWGLSRLLTEPIGRLTDATQKIAAGDYTARVSTEGRDELAAVAQSFNLMVEHVEDSDRKLRREIAERKEAQEKTRRLNLELEQRVLQRTKELEAANKELEAFSYSVSHDLRAPLRHIHGFGELLAKEASGQLSPKAQHYLKTISNTTHRMGKLIDDLLAFSRSGRTEMRKTSVDLQSLVNEVIQSFASAVNGRKIEWKVSPLPKVQADAALLKQVLVNLVDNAIKYTHLRNPAIIEIGCDGNENGQHTLFVRDNGAGFDMQYSHKLFGVFQRLHSDKEFPGTGIGLANVRRIIARHGGRTWAQAEIDKGATFYFTLEGTDSNSTT